MEKEATPDRTNGELINDLYRPLRRFAAVVGDPDMEPDDLVQEAFVRTLRVRRLDDLDDPGAYLRRVILNTVRSLRRRAGRAARVLPVLGASAPDATAPAYPSDVADLFRLNPRWRAVLFLHDVERYTFEEVAEMLDIAPAAARMTATRARRRLRELLDEEVDA